MKAWRTTYCDVVCIVAATSRAKAKYATVKSAKDAGYPGRWTAVKAVREPKHDKWATGAIAVDGRCWNEEDVAKTVVFSKQTVGKD